MILSSFLYAGLKFTLFYFSRTFDCIATNIMILVVRYYSPNNHNIKSVKPSTLIDIVIWWPLS